MNTIAIFEKDGETPLVSLSLLNLPAIELYAKFIDNNTSIIEPSSGNIYGGQLEKVQEVDGSGGYLSTRINRMGMAVFDIVLGTYFLNQYKVHEPEA